MAKIDIEQIKADREAGTQGPWDVDPDGRGEMSIVAGEPVTRVSMPGDYPGGVTEYPFHVIDGCGCCDSPFGNEGKVEFDARRIARVPELEDALIEAMGLLEDLHDQLSAATHIEEETFLALQSFLERFK